MVKEWEEYPLLDHLPAKMREQLEPRRRLRKVRYWLFRLQTLVERGEALVLPEAPPGFVEFWLGEKPKYAIDARGQKIPVPSNKDKYVADLGSFKNFAKVWDVDENLFVYIRHSSVWQEWNAKLLRIVPVLGED